MKQRVFYTEIAYLCGILSLALGTALMEKAAFGISMVVAPAYLLYRKLSLTWSFFTFGMAEYLLQAVLLVVMMLVLRKARVSFLFSFVTAVLYGFVLDGCMALVGLTGAPSLAARIGFFVIGSLLGAVGVAFMFHTYVAPEAYELFVREISTHFGKRISRVKTVYDCVSCLAGLLMSFAFFGFGHFEGIKAGTILCAVANGWLIGQIGRHMEKRWKFSDALRFRRFFAPEKNDTIAV